MSLLRLRQRPKISSFRTIRGSPLIHEIASQGAYLLHDYERLYPKKKLLGH